MSVWLGLLVLGGFDSCPLRWWVVVWLGEVPGVVSGAGSLVGLVRALRPGWVRFLPSPR